MADYAISGVWKDNNGVITHYAFHVDDAKAKAIGTMMKKNKAEAIALLEIKGNSVMTLVWNYISATWRTGENVYVAGTGANKYLKSNPDDKLSDNLGHLICWNGFIV